MSTVPTSTAAQAAQQQILAAFAETEKRIKPAILADVPSNGHALTAYLMKHNLQPSPDNFYRAISDLMTSLIWVVEPAKLSAIKQNARPATQQSQEQAMKPFNDAKKAAEIADAKAKADQASIQQAKDLISAYLPTKSTPMGQKLDYADQARMQAEWSKALQQAIEKKRNLQEFAKALATTIQKRYTDRERASERSQR